MSATITWHQGGGLANSGSASDTQFFTDLKAMFDDKSGDANFKWEVASSNLGSTPRQITLKRKDASDGRILIVMWDSSAPTSHPALCNASINTGIPYIGYFPNGNVDTPSNLTSNSGTILGDDTDAVHLANAYYRSSMYNGSTDRFYYMDSEAGVFIWVQNPASTPSYWFGAGDLVVDAADDAYPCTMGSSSNGLGGWSSGFPIGWNSTVNGPNTTDQQSYSIVISHLVSTNKRFFSPIQYSSAFGSAGASTNLLRDNSVDKLFFVPIYLTPYGRGLGIQGKIRQMAVGPDASAPFESPNMSGPTVAAIVMSAYTSTITATPWVTNFKV